MKNKNMIFVWGLIVLAVVVLLVFMTINKRDGANNLGQNMENLADGIVITVLNEGAGAMAEDGDIVTVNYTGRLLDDTVFDSNIDPQFNHVQPFPFTLGSGAVIAGWDLGIKGMKVGEKRKLEIQPELAYGEYGVSDVIPPNSTLVFEVELLAIAKQ